MMEELLRSASKFLSDLGANCMELSMALDSIYDQDIENTSAGGEEKQVEEKQVEMENPPTEEKKKRKTRKDVEDEIRLECRRVSKEVSKEVAYGILKDFGTSSIKELDKKDLRPCLKKLKETTKESFESELTDDDTDF